MKMERAFHFFAIVPVILHHAKAYEDKQHKDRSRAVVIKANATTTTATSTKNTTTILMTLLVDPKNVSSEFVVV